MTELFPPETGKRIDKILGLGSVALITDECLYALTPCRYNGVPGTISLKAKASPGCCDVHQGMPLRHQTELLNELEEQGTTIELTMPMVYRPVSKSWKEAARILRVLAQAADDQATTCYQQEAELELAVHVAAMKAAKKAAKKAEKGKK